MNSDVLFAGWTGPLRVVCVGTLAYVALLIILRVTGKRTLSQMNAFDFVVTVALGSTLATILLSKGVSLVEGVVAFAVLVVLQFVVTWLSVRSKGFSNLVKAQPRLLFFRGAFLEAALRKERVTEDEVLAAIRAARFPRLEDVEAVVLETAGTFAVLGRHNHEPATTLRGVRDDRK